MNNSKEQEEFAELMSECRKSVDKGREKIIKKVCDNLYIEKLKINIFLILFFFSKIWV